ncbi:hypothetical protein [Oscillibacter ruminantium]|uniref:hypothetical protein n=1 Tax=Oscillibacter ruminantium TaxID=1263547 RepID=UPI00332172D4
MENEKLIAALRHNYAPDLHVIEDMQNAADALERLTAENAVMMDEIKLRETEIEKAIDLHLSSYEEFKKSLGTKDAEIKRLNECLSRHGWDKKAKLKRDNLQHEVNCLKIERGKYQSERDRLQAELDAAVKFIQHIDSEYGRYINDDGFARWRGKEPG